MPKKELRTGVKLLIIIVVLGLLGTAYWAARSGKFSWVTAKKRVATEGKKIDIPKGKGKNIIRAGINTWGGYVPGVYYNSGFAPNENSRFYKEQGILVEFKRFDEVDKMRSAWRNGDIDVMGLVTVDSLPVEIAGLAQDDPKNFMQISWSRGGDAVVGTRAINSAADLAGKKVAVALNTPSHSLFLLWLAAGGIDYGDLNIVGTPSSVQSAQMFKSGAVDCAVVWSPDDEDCIKSVPGSRVVFSTREATHAIADTMVVKGSWAVANQGLLAAFLKGWYKAVAEINGDPGSKAAAAQIFSANFSGIDVGLSTLMIDNCRLASYGDAMQFYGMIPGATMSGDELYTKTGSMFTAAGFNVGSLPPWRSIIDTTALASIGLTGPGYEPEASMKFSPPTQAMEVQPAVAEKGASVNFETGSSVLTIDGKIAIDEYFAPQSKVFAGSRVRIEGNTDSVGSRDLNMQLSHDRAMAVAAYLVSKYGFDQQRFVVVGNGPDKPVASNKTAEGKARNRRTDFALIGE